MSRALTCSKNVTATELLNLRQGGYGILLLWPVYSTQGPLMGLTLQVVRPEYVARYVLANSVSYVAAFAHNASDDEVLIYWTGGNAVGPFSTLAQLVAMNGTTALVWCSAAQLEARTWNMCEVQRAVSVSSLGFMSLGIFLVSLFVTYLVLQLVIIIAFCTWQKRWEKAEAAAALQAAKEANHLNLGHEVRELPVVCSMSHALHSSCGHL
jgi:hypothetical protein